MSKLIDYYKSRKEAIETAFTIIIDNGCVDTRLELDTLLQYMELQERIIILELCSVLKGYGDNVEPRVASLAGSLAKQMLKPPRIQAKCENEGTIRMRETAHKRLEAIYKAGNADKAPFMAIATMLNPWLAYRDTFFSIPKEHIKEENDNGEESGNEDNGKQGSSGKAKRSA